MSVSVREEEKSHHHENNSNSGVVLMQQENKKLDEEQTLEKEVEGLTTWASMIETMDDQQLRNYLKNRPPDNINILETETSGPSKKQLRLRRDEGDTKVNDKKGKHARTTTCAKNVKRDGKCKRPNYTGIMATVWKFHKENDI